MQNFGFDAREAADASVILVQRAADLASVMGGSVNDALIAVGAALRGEADPLERYGASISAARVEQFALANGLAATKAEITDAVKLQARYGLILSDTARVSGDFANTSGDLANAQRIVAAEASNLAAQIGEALAPAFEAILTQGPSIINLFASLTPAMADSATAAQAAAAGLTVGATNIVLGFGGMSNAVMSFVDLAQAGIESITGLWQAISVGDRDFSEFNTQMDEFNKRRAADFINNAGIRMPRAIREGIAPINALGQALAGLAQSDDDLHALEIGFERLRIQSGLTDRETQTLLRSLLAQADALEFTAGEVAFLEGELAVLNETFDDGGRANADYLASIQAIDSGPFSSITTRFTTFTSELEEIPARMHSVVLETREAAGLLGQSLNPFDEAPEDIALSAREFFARVTAEINREAEFQAGIVELNLRGHFDLARMLGDQGPTMQATLTGFLKNDVLAGATNAALKTGTTAEAEAWGDWMEEQIAAAPPGPARDALIVLMTEGIIDSPEVEEAIIQGTRRAANTTRTSYEDQLEREIVEMKFNPALQEALADMFQGVKFVISEGQFQFPSSLSGMIDVLVNPIGAATSQMGAGTTVINNIYNPTTTDLPTNIAQATQSTAAVGSLLNRTSVN